jgi:hypothetical protein
MTETQKISKAEWHKAVDAWLQEQSAKAGEERQAEWPPDKLGLRGGIENRVATPDLISGYAPMTGDPNPLWSDQDYARDTRWGGIIAPPTFENAIGAPYDYGEIYKLPGFYTILDSGCLREYFTVTRPLDEFTATDIYLGVTEISEPQQPYRRFRQQIKRSYYNQRHETAATVVRETTIIAEAPGEEHSFVRELFGEIKRPCYRKEQLDEIYQGYEEELAGKWRRGAETRYWEDVVEGQEIHPLRLGPIGDVDSQFLFKTGHIRSFAFKWLALKQDLARAVVDPETGEYRSFIDRYFSDRIARESGFPYALGFTLQNEGCAAHAVTNWMGDDGFFTRLDLKHHSVNFQGEVNRVQGKVSRKYSDKRRHLVDLEVWIESQDGRLITKGTATVQLLSRG